MFVRKLKSLDQSQSFVHIPSNGKVVDSHLSQDTIGVNYEKSPEWNTFVFFQDIVGLKKWILIRVYIWKKNIWKILKNK